MIIFVLIMIVIYTLILKVKLHKENTQYMYYRDIPSDDSPAVVGKIIKGHADGNDIISTILDLSYKGYIRIETEEIKGKEQRTLYLEKNINTTELKEYEMFLLNQIFKKSSKIVFEDYIKSVKFKQDFITFDNMLNRRIKMQNVYKTSILKNINKIILLISFMILGISLLYSMIIPITLQVCSIMRISIKTEVIINIAISSALYLLIAYIYISYINKTTNARESINLSISYIIISIIVICIVGFIDIENILKILYSELSWYKIIINFVLSIITILYMFNIIGHKKKNEYLYYSFIIISLVSIFLELKIVMCISIIFLATYIFFKTPKHVRLKQEDYMYRWISFKRYLEDYSMLIEQDEKAILIWERYLIYAISLGVNKEIIKKYAKLVNWKILNETYWKKVYVEYFE